MKSLSLLFLLLVLCCGLYSAQAQTLPTTLTPPSPATPEIHGATVFGVHPGHPFLFTVAATGNRPMTFSADHLPPGLSIDASSGRITGMAPSTGYYSVTLQAKNALGEAHRTLRIKAGATLALTPPMGWNSWNCFAGAVTENDIRAAANAMVESGLIDHGWTYVNVDDYWQVNPKKGKTDATLAGLERNPDGTIHPNPRFPDMKGLADYIHARGLKAGLYSSPGPFTCGGCTGSYQHEAQDARQYADWGFDFLKYDWCSYGKIYEQEDGGRGLPGLEKPYRVMANAIAQVPRDIVFSFCQYGMGDVWKWGAAIGGNSWRVSGDIRDSWKSVLANAEGKAADLAPYAGPGHWNDPDMLVVGKVGWGPQLHASHLTPDEQYSHISLWCLQADPLLIGCDLTQLDPFTLGLLTNDEVIDVDQDALGKAAQIVQPTGGSTPIQIWARPLENGSVAVGLFNLGTTTAAGTVNWSDLHLSGAWKVRDLWRQRDLGSFPDKFQSGMIPPHGVVLVRMMKS
jgi:alpha-galactosidase